MFGRVFGNTYPEEIIWLWDVSNILCKHEGVKVVLQTMLIVLSLVSGIKLNNKNNRRKNRRRIRRVLSYLYFEVAENYQEIDKIKKAMPSELKTDKWEMYQERIKDTGPMLVFYLTEIYGSIAQYNKMLEKFKTGGDDEQEKERKEITELLDVIRKSCLAYMKEIDDLPNMNDFMCEAKKRYYEIKNTDSSFDDHTPKWMQVQS